MQSRSHNNQLTIVLLYTLQCVARCLASPWNEDDVHNRQSLIMALHVHTNKPYGMTVDFCQLVHVATGGGVHRSDHDARYFILALSTIFHFITRQNSMLPFQQDSGLFVALNSSKNQSQSNIRGASDEKQCHCYIHFNEVNSYRLIVHFAFEFFNSPFRQFRTCHTCPFFGPYQNNSSLTFFLPGVNLSCLPDINAHFTPFFHQSIPESIT